jgi:hypothetical protein
MSTERLGTLVALPLPSRVAADIVRLILATQSEDDPKERAGIARTVIELARRRGLRRRYAAGVGGVRTRDGVWWLAPVCLRCCWVGAVSSDEDAAAAEATRHAC